MWPSRPSSSSSSSSPSSVGGGEERRRRDQQWKRRRRKRGEAELMLVAVGVCLLALMGIAEAATTTTRYWTHSISENCHCFMQTY